MTNKLKIRTCANCGGTFAPNRPVQKFCCVACGQQAAYARRKAVLDAYSDRRTHAPPLDLLTRAWAKASETERKAFLASIKL
jgi:predicted RNA-binding Zn-ribbon protein involved in translation (DUF1610 family)